MKPFQRFALACPELVRIGNESFAVAKIELDTLTPTQRDALRAGSIDRLAQIVDEEFEALKAVRDWYAPGKEAYLKLLSSLG